MTENYFNFAFLDSEDTVINIAVFDSENPDSILLENVKNQMKAFDVKSCVTYGEAYIGGKFLDNRFIKPQPYPSWILNIDTYEWESPVKNEFLEEDSFWDENSLSWKPYTV